MTRKRQNWYLYNVLDRFRYHQNMLVLPDTDTDTRIGTALVLILNFIQQLTMHAYKHLIW